MATSIRDTPRMLSPASTVIWAGFSADAGQLQRCGWDFSIEHHPWDRKMGVLMRHRQAGWVGMGRTDLDHWHRASADFYRGMYFTQQERDGVPIHIERMTYEGNVLVDSQRYAPAKWFNADMRTAVVYPDDPVGQVMLKTALHGIFRAYAPEAQEIIVEPKTVAGLLEEITKLQDPELLAIRQRNRNRDAREERAAAEHGQANEKVLATLVALAA